MNQMCIEGVMYHPTFLYESVWNIIVFAALLIIRRYNPTRGHLFMYYLIMYSVGRFFIEGMRTDSLINVGLKQAQLISVAIFICAILFLIYRYKKKKVTLRYDNSNII